MSEYGIHLTQYGRLSDADLYSMYRESVYEKLSENEKLDLLQETVNRDAVERGELGTPEVRFASMFSNEIGRAENGVIYINHDVAVNGIQIVEYNGQLYQHNVDDYNIQVLNTAIHENAHCFQDQVIDGTIHIDDDRLASEYEANSFANSVVSKDGNLQLGSQYLTGETPGGYHIYYFQATERDAFFSAETKTEEILRELSTKYGVEPSFEAYSQTVEAIGFHTMEKEAIELYQNPDFVKDLNQTLVNQYYGTNIPVDVSTERAVKAEMIESYRNIQEILQEYDQLMKEDGKMSFDPYKPVTLEEYNQTLRDAVNAYYIHAINDPNISHDEAIRLTMEMSERYLNEVEYFQEAQNEQMQISDAAGQNVTTMAYDDVSVNVEEEFTAGNTNEVDNGLESSNDIESENLDDGLDNDDEGLDGGLEI